MADRMGHVDLVIQSLEGAYGPWREHAWRGLKVIGWILLKVGRQAEGLCELQIAPFGVR